MWEKRLTDVELTKQADKHITSIEWIHPRAINGNEPLEARHSGSQESENPGLTPDLGPQLQMLVTTILGADLKKCFRKLYIVARRYQNEQRLDTLISVGCIASPAPKLSDTRANVKRIVDIQKGVKGRDEDGLTVPRLNNAKIGEVSWVIIMKQDGESIDHLVGFYGLLISIRHTRYEADTWVRRTDTTMYGFKFHWLKIVTQYSDWRRKMIEAGGSSILLSVDDSTIVQTFREFREEHSHLSLNHSVRTKEYEEAMKRWKDEQSQVVTLSRSGSDASGNSGVQRVTKTQSTQADLKRPAPVRPKRKRLGLGQLRKAFRAAQEQRSLRGHGSTSSIASSLVQPGTSTSFTWESLFPHTSGLPTTNTSESVP